MVNKKDIRTASSIRTRYHGATNHMGSRFSATDGFKKMYVPYRYDLSTEENHAEAANAFIEEYYNDRKHFVTVLDGESGLFFDGDYYWTWKNLAWKEAA